MAAGCGCGAAGCKKRVLGCCGLQRQSGFNSRGEAAAGRPAPKWRFHLLCLHAGLPSSQLWELAFRTSSDPAGCAFVTAGLQLVQPLWPISAFSFHPSAVSIIFFTIYLEKKL